MRAFQTSNKILAIVRGFFNYKCEFYQIKQQLNRNFLLKTLTEKLARRPRNGRITL